MNKIEQRFFDAFVKHASCDFISSVFSESHENVIAEYRIKKDDITKGEEFLYTFISINFPTLEESANNDYFDISLNSQEQIGAYTADFVARIQGFGSIITQLVIEIDGHDFHEKTKEQAMLDKKRSREITRNGYCVIRFTGSEVFTNATKCVQETMEILLSLTFERVLVYSGYHIEQRKYFDKMIKGETEK